MSVLMGKDSAHHEIKSRHITSSLVRSICGTVEFYSILMSGDQAQRRFGSGATDPGVPLTVRKIQRRTEAPIVLRIPVGAASAKRHEIVSDSKVCLQNSAILHLRVVLRILESEPYRAVRETTH